MFENTNFLGGGLGKEDGGQGIPTDGKEDCSAECQKRPKCTHWTFVAAWRDNCYLKSSLGEKTEYEGGVSGTYGAHCGNCNTIV